MSPIGLRQSCQEWCTWQKIGVSSECSFMVSSKLHTEYDTPCAVNTGKYAALYRPCTQPRLCTRTAYRCSRRLHGSVRAVYMARIHTQPCTRAVYVHGRADMCTVRTRRVRAVYGLVMAVYTARKRQCTRPCTRLCSRHVYGRVAVVYGPCTSVYDRAHRRVRAVYLAVYTACIHSGATAMYTVRTWPRTRFVLGRVHVYTACIRNL